MELCYNCNRYIIPGSAEWSVCQCKKEPIFELSPEFYVTQKEALRHWFSPGVPDIGDCDYGELWDQVSWEGK